MTYSCLLLLMTKREPSLPRSATLYGTHLPLTIESQSMRNKMTRQCQSIMPSHKNIQHCTFNWCVAIRYYSCLACCSISSVILGSVFNLAFVACLFFFLIPFCSTYIGATLVGISYPFLKSMESISLPLPSPPPPNPSSDEAKGGEDQKTAVADGDVENGGGKEEKKVEGGTARDSQWLTYWVVFACVHFTDVW
mmetsp:Transcript_34902/g.56173  ORF Transcript_34902/g.56173 Transcript_34902/m.56173 type:complete len:194 (-) Transcript_34902:724-1305(-)